MRHEGERLGKRGKGETKQSFVLDVRKGRSDVLKEKT